MSIKKLVKRGGIFFILIGIGICAFLFLQNKRMDYKQKIVIQESVMKNQNYTEIPYIEIPKIHLSRIIKETVVPSVLDQKYVGIWNAEKDLRKSNHIVLAGHNVKDVFGNIKNLKNEDEIKVHYKDRVLIYEVIHKKIIGVTELSYLEETKEKQVTLLTCTGNDQTRQIVIGKLKSITK